MRTLIKNGTILTMDLQGTLIHQGHLIIEDDEIIYVGEAKLEEGIDEIIDAKGGFVLPGMINTYGEIQKLCNRSCEKTTGKMNESLTYLTMKYGALEALKGGITTTVDVGTYRSQAALACEEMGIRALLGEAIKNEPVEHNIALEKSKQFVKDWADSNLITPMLSVHSLLTCDPPLMEDAMALALQEQCMIVIQAAFDEDEMKLLKQDYHVSAIERLEQLHFLNEHTMIAGAHYVSKEDLSLMKRRNITVASNGYQAMMQGRELSPIHEMNSYQIPVGFAIGDPCFIPSLSLFPLMRQLLMSQRVLYRNQQVISSKDALYMATVGGAQALHLDHALGSLEVGKKADLIIISTDHSWMYPHIDPYDTIVYHAQASDISDVFVDGIHVISKKTSSLLLSALKEELEMEIKEAGE